MGGFRKLIKTDIPGLYVDHIRNVHSGQGNGSTGHSYLQELVLTHQADHHLTLARPAQKFPDPVGINAIAGHDGIVHFYEFVAYLETGPVARAIGQHVYDIDGIIEYLELYADPLEVALQVFVHFGDIDCRNIDRMRIQVCQHSVDSVVAERIHGHGVHVPGTYQIHDLFDRGVFVGSEKAGSGDISAQPETDYHPEDHYDSKKKGKPNL